MTFKNIILLGPETIKLSNLATLISGNALNTSDLIVIRRHSLATYIISQEMQAGILTIYHSNHYHNTPHLFIVISD